MRTATGVLLLLLAAGAGAQADDHEREGNPESRAKKDPLEGKAAPALAVEGWMNTDGQALTLEDLRGKVVVLDYWGVW